MNDAASNDRQKLTIRHFGTVKLSVAIQRYVIAVILLVGVLVMVSLGRQGVLWPTAATGAAVEISSGVRPMPVNVMTVSLAEDSRQTRIYTGTIRAKKRSDLGFELGGMINAVAVEEGDLVSEGTLLASLDTDRLLANEAAIMAQIEQAESVLAELNAGPRKETIAAARAARAAAESDVSLAESNFKRRKSLFEQAAISAEEFDQVRFGLSAAKAKFQSASEQLAELEAGTRAEKVDAQLATVKQLQASLKELQVSIKKSELLAPFPGIITRRYLDPGSIVAAGTPVLRLVDAKNLEAWIGLPVESVTELEVGGERFIRVNGTAYPATLSAKLQELDSQTRTQTVIWKFDPASTSKIVSGQLCEIEMEIENSNPVNSFWVPTSSLSKGVRGLWAVMALRPDSESAADKLNVYEIEKRDVEVVRVETNRVLVRGTLVPGDRIVTDGIHRLAPGQLVVPAP